ncbi:MAG: exodeoxyribonuclease VII small subunit [Clostridia bacterium]|nr:exodeoxyribonuclease VII small subunit [Clostridia bacterium]
MENNITFEESLARLEKIVRQLEDGDVTLDDSVKLFEEGIKLSGICSEYLKNAQQKVEILMENGTDTPDVKDFKANE